MIKKIAVSDLQIGMFVHEFGGAWIDHPFWKSRFKVQHVADLNKIRESGISELFIDTLRGIDLKAAVAAPLTVEVAVATEKPPRVALDVEVSRALKICSRAKEAVVTMFNDARMGHAINAEESANLIGEISASVERHPQALISLSRLKTSDEYTYMHSVAVCALMVALARQLDMPEEWVREAGVAGLLHDIGKMTIAHEILNKPGRLTDDEFSIVKGHPEGGLRILQQSRLNSVTAIDVCLHHHEKYDGSGYPFGLVGEQISVFSRMAAICDVYDAITSERPYKKAWGPAHSIREMATWAGHFDERIFQAFVRAVGIYPIGALVRLQSERIGLVVEQNDKSLLKPKVVILVSARTRMPLERRLIDLASYTENDRIVRIESAKEWELSNLEEIWTGISTQKGSIFR
ncbi:HD-GYP domain-containing protein [Pseudomonas sp. dw_358]|uniref:HD-GYP domain-containing protein n=1 Tax=Pseudomonas sp. dw_358 TaxID=2720083 RepID=UPI001BD574F3|nr:HD-GYP domain-containing protein [Pseudomonas sp. dw_358]